MKAQLQEVYKIAEKIAKYPPIDRAGYDGHRCAYCYADVGFKEDDLGDHSNNCLWRKLKEAIEWSKQS
jgi:hypothetical protein